jgi:eukaryotic-like serine/threonine-protein kinase
VELESGDPRQVGPYWLLGRLGSGGMGRVFLGQSPGGRYVAVKVIRSELAEQADFRIRFVREVAAARQVSGLFTAPVVDADLDAPVPWLATAYVAGPSLDDAVARHGPLPVASVLALAAGLAEGLQAIHAAGIVHRDLKPSNVLLAEDGPRVIDFGISVTAEGFALTRTGLVVGSPDFMSPEQAQGHPVGPPSDVFSLGAVLVFAATGGGPFGSGPTAALLYRVVHAPPTTEALPGVFRPLVERCLAKDPQQRPSTAQLLSELNARPAAGWLQVPITYGLSTHAPTEAMMAGSSLAKTSDSIAGNGGNSGSRSGRGRFSGKAIFAVLAVVVALALSGTATALTLTRSSTSTAGVSTGTRSHPPATSRPATRTSVVGTPVTTAPVTTAPVTTAPVTTAPVTTAPVTTAPVTTAPVTTAPVTTPVPENPGAVLAAYYGDIESGNYKQAFALIGNGATTGQSYQEFVAGFACTGPQTLTENWTSGDQVNFNLAAVDSCTGATRYYTGTDTVSNGVIVAANVVQTGLRQVEYPYSGRPRSRLAGSRPTARGRLRLLRRDPGSLVVSGAGRGHRLGALSCATSREPDRL